MLIHNYAQGRINHTILARKHVVWAIKRENRSRDSTWAKDWEKKVRTGGRQDSQKMSQGGNISPILGEAPTVPIETKICMAGNLADVITCAKFQDDILGSTILQGRSNFPFSYWFLHGPYNSAACDLISPIAILQTFLNAVP